MGCPTGLRLRPPLFLIYINDLPSCINSSQLYMLNYAPFLNVSKRLEDELIDVTNNTIIIKGKNVFSDKGILLNNDKTQNINLY